MPPTNASTRPRQRRRDHSTTGGCCPVDYSASETFQCREAYQCGPRSARARPVSMPSPSPIDHDTFLDVGLGSPGPQYGLATAGARSLFGRRRQRRDGPARARATLWIGAAPPWRRCYGTRGDGRWSFSGWRCPRLYQQGRGEGCRGLRPAHRDVGRFLVCTSRQLRGDAQPWRIGRDQSAVASWGRGWVGRWSLLVVCWPDARRAVPACAS